MSRRDWFRLVDVALGSVLVTLGLWPVLGGYGPFLIVGILLLGDERNRGD